MYNKVKKCLESMAYDFVECESAELKSGIKLSKGFWINKNYHNKELYIETYDSGEIAIWNYESADLLYHIPKKEVYVMMFELAWALNN